MAAAAQSIESILYDAGLIPSSCIGLLAESVSAMIEDMKKAEIDIANLALTDLGMFANPGRNLKLLTIHQSKGREFTAVAMVALHDGVLPYHNKYNALTTHGEEEARRLLYVAITRARRVLQFYTVQHDWRPICRFLQATSFSQTVGG